MELHFTSHSTNLLDFSNPGTLLCAGGGGTKENKNKNQVPVLSSAAKICECECVRKMLIRCKAKGCMQDPSEASGHGSLLVQHYSNLGELKKNQIRLKKEKYSC